MNPVLVVLMVGLGALAQGSTGMGFGLLCAPFLIGSYGPAEGVRQVVLLSLVLNAVFLGSEARSARGRDALGLLLPALLVAPLLTLWLRPLDPRVLLVVAGSLTTGSAAVLALGWQPSWLRGRVGAVGAGVVSAAMNVAGGLAGPAAALYAVGAGWPAASVRPTLQLYGLGLNLVTLLSLGLPPLHPPLLAGLVGGVLAGLLLARRLPQRLVRQAILALAALGGVLVVLRGVG